MKVSWAELVTEPLMTVGAQVAPLTEEAAVPWVKASHAAWATVFEDAKDHSIALPAVSTARILA
jgi:hypothetical protein